MCVCLQDYVSMVALVEKLPEHDQAQKPPVQLQYAFALNRRNQPGDRNKALAILEKVQSFSFRDSGHEFVVREAGGKKG